MNLDFSSKKNTAKAITAVALFSCVTLIQVKAATVEMPLSGFQIEALDTAPSAVTTTPLAMFLPASEGFAPNINVQVQPFTQSISDYVTLSKAQFEQLNWKVISDKMTADNEWTVEYTGQQQGNDLHFYARAISKNGKVYLATGTAKESHWPTVGDTLRDHIDSFKTK